MELLDSLLFMLNEMSPYILLGFLIAGLMHAFVSKSTFSRHLSGTGWRPVLKAALIGVPLPLCSCGVLPTAIGMRRSGASRAASTSFLIATPQTGVDSIAATWSLLGPAFAIIRPVAALVTSFLGGLAVGCSERHNEAQLPERQTATKNRQKPTLIRRTVDALQYGFIDLVDSIGGWLVAGLIIAALITVYVPTDFFGTLGSTPILSMIAVLVLAIPMYVCATGSIPIAMSLMLKGLSPGTALVLLMAGPAANFASFTLISREMGRKATIIYLAAIIVGAMTFGLATDYLMPRDWFITASASPMHCHTHGLPIFPTICSTILVALLIYSLIKRFTHRHPAITDMTKTYTITGMNCPHCQATVTKSISAVNGITKVEVSLSDGIAIVEGEHKPEELIAAVRAAGFDVSGEAISRHTRSDRSH